MPQPNPVPPFHGNVVPPHVPMSPTSSSSSSYNSPAHNPADNPADNPILSGDSPRSDGTKERPIRLFSPWR
eukprot:4308418-Prymnesium_polylepis.1